MADRSPSEIETENQKLRQRLEELEAGVRRVLTQVGDDLCWRDGYDYLGKLIGEEFKPKLMVDRKKMLANCEAFTKSMYEGGPYEPVWVRKSEEATK